MKLIQNDEVKMKITQDLLNKNSWNVQCDIIILQPYIIYGHFLLSQFLLRQHFFFYIIREKLQINNNKYKKEEEEEEEQGNKMRENTSLS